MISPCARRGAHPGGRLRAGLTQAELAEKAGRDRTVVARWEQGIVAPSVETLVELVQACGFDLPLEIVPFDDTKEAELGEAARITPTVGSTRCSVELTETPS